MKEIIRLQNLAKRNSLSKKQVVKKSATIGKRLLHLPEFEKARTVMLYFGVNNEVETKDIIEEALLARKRVALPLSDFGRKKIAPKEISSLKELHKTKHGLFEPCARKEVKTSDLDLIVVPGIAFDKQGNRIGTGKGLYDSLLRRTSTRIPLVGLCFEENLHERLPSESHDVKMDIVVTDKQTVRCKLAP